MSKAGRDKPDRLAVATFHPRLDTACHTEQQLDLTSSASDLTVSGLFCTLIQATLLDRLTPQPERRARCRPSRCIRYRDSARSYHASFISMGSANYEARTRNAVETEMHGSQQLYSLLGLLAQVDAFTPRPFGGNPAAVCLLEPDHGRIDDATRLAIAAEMNLSETSFVEPVSGESDEGYDYRKAKQVLVFCPHPCFVLHKRAVSSNSACHSH